MDVSIIDEMIKSIRFDDYYIEATFQFKLLMQLAKRYDENKIFPERSIEYYGLYKKAKKEADIIIEPDNELPVVFELKMPMNGQVPEQMYKFAEDIVFLEELKASKLFGKCFLITITNDPNFWQGNKNDGIYAPFRKGAILQGKIYKPTGMGKNEEFHQLSGEYKIRWNIMKNNFRNFIVEVL